MEADGGFPAQFATGLGGVPHEEFHVAGAFEAVVHPHMVMPVEAELPEGRFDEGQATDSELEPELREGRFDAGQAGSDAINPTHDDLSSDDLGRRDDLGR